LSPSGGYDVFQLFLLKNHKIDQFIFDLEKMATFIIVNFLSFQEYIFQVLRSVEWDLLAAN